MKNLLVIFGLASLWDGFTTLWGTTTILGGGTASMIAAGMFSLIILTLLLNTALIIRTNNELMKLILKSSWLIAIIYDMYTSYMGNMYFIIGDNTDGARVFLLLGLTVLISGSPILFSLIKEYEKITI